MDDATLERACVAIVAAGAEVRSGVSSDAVRARVSQAAAAITPSLERQVRGVAARNGKLFRDARLEPEDVAQEVLRRLIEAPPCNAEGRDPVAAVFGWARAVANNMLLDRRRRTRREVVARQPGADEESAGAPEPADAERAVEEVLEVLGEIDRMHAESEQLAGYKHLRETFLVLVKDPEITALELAQRVGLIEVPDAEPMSEGYRGRARKAAQYAWKLRQRMLDAMSARMGHARRDGTEA